MLLVFNLHVNSVLPVRVRPYGYGGQWGCGLYNLLGRRRGRLCVAGCALCVVGCALWVVRCGLALSLVVGGHAVAYVGMGAWSLRGLTGV